LLCIYQVACNVQRFPHSLGLYSVASPPVGTQVLLNSILFTRPKILFLK
jgi:hypothetical protein